MDYKEATQETNGVLLTGVRNFGLVETLDNGSTFRWSVRSNKAAGVVNGKIIILKYLDETTLYIHNITLEEFYDFYENYFDLKTEYQPIIDELRMKNKPLENLIPAESKLRLVKQDYVESIITAMISQNNNIKRIKGIVDNLCNRYGKLIYVGKRRVYAFPTLDELQNLTVDDFKRIGCGYRSEGLYLICKRMKVLTDAYGSLEAYFDKMTYDCLERTLMCEKQIGPKVASFIVTMTGSCKNFNKSFVIDTWISTAMKNLFNVYADKSPQFSKWLDEHFGDNCAIAQQNIFYYYRNR